MLLERGYQKAVRMDLERSLRRLKEKAEDKAKKKEDLKKDAEEIENNLNFVERTALIARVQVEVYRQNLVELKHEIEHRGEEIRHDTLIHDARTRVDESQQERSSKYQDMATYRAQIEKMRKEDRDAAMAAKNAEQNNAQQHNGAAQTGIAHSGG